jgi:uncharacterized membrane protein HdeD (DUF308 family)
MTQSNYRANYGAAGRVAGLGDGEMLEHVLARNWRLIALRGAVAILFGVLALIWPDATALTLVILFAAYLALDGVLAIVAGMRAARRQEKWWPFALEGIANLMVAAIAILWPGITLLALVYLLGVWAIFTGVLMALPGLSARGPADKWLLVAGGILSVLLGIIVISQPLIGLAVLITLIAVYAILFGGVMLYFAYRLHRRQASSGVASAPRG